MHPFIAAIFLTLIGGLSFALIICIPFYFLCLAAGSTLMPFSNIVGIVIVLLASIWAFEGWNR